MKRMIDHHLKEWKDYRLRKPLLLRGARQVGKTYAVRKLGQSFDNFVEINLETETKVRQVFDLDLDPKRMIREFSLITGKDIVPGKTLLFIDEIQAVPRALIALRYFYEEMPKLHVIAAGSLIDFAIQEVGVPVGRLQFMYMYPVSFIEFLAAINNTVIMEEILKRDPKDPISDVVHTMTLRKLAEYMALGGMPEVIHCWINTHDPRLCTRIHSSILDAYRMDFSKYARTKQIKYVELVFNSIAQQLGGKFKYSNIEGDYRKRELAPALDLLETAGVAHRIWAADSQGIPLGARLDFKDYKVIFSDIGLTQALLKLDLAEWFLNPLQELINKGDLAEAFVGQEILAYNDPHRKNKLFYWHRESPNSQAEIDYVIQSNEHIIPIEVKSGAGTTLKSLHSFLDNHQKSPYGIRFSAQNYSIYEKIHSYPLYAVAKVIAANSDDVKQSIASLLP